MTASGRPAARPLEGIGRFLEIQTLGLNLSFAVAFLLLASGGWPSVRTTVLVIVAFVAARNAGHSFNRWADRRYDAENPRTRDRALVTGQRSPAFALGVTAGSAGVLLLAAYLLNPLAFVLAPVALALLLGYSYTKRVTSWTTPFLGLVQGIAPAAIYIAVQGTLPPDVLLAVGALVAWGTAFETVHSLGDVTSDRRLGLFSLPVALGERTAARLVPVLHAVALLLFVAFGAAVRLADPYYVALVGMAALAAWTDWILARRPAEPRVPFELHFALGVLYLGGVVAALLAGAGVTL